MIKYGNITKPSGSIKYGGKVKENNNPENKNFKKIN